VSDNHVAHLLLLLDAARNQSVGIYEITENTITFLFRETRTTITFTVGVPLDFKVESSVSE
jgi:hypothetical protein